MIIYFRTDSSITIGTGHVMRCLTLADELRNRDAEVSFICREETGNLIEIVENRGYRVLHLGRNINLENDKKLTQIILKDLTSIPDWLIIDNYDIDVSWESFLRKFVKKIMVIDDLANRKHDCDLLLNQNYNVSEKSYHGLMSNHCIQLLGTKYAMLQPQFCEVRANMRERNVTVKRILVFISGSDIQNVTSKVLCAIQMLGRFDIIIDVVIGIANPNRREIERLAAQIPNTTCHFNVNNMAELMASADLCIGACGTTTWERCCVGLPSIVIVLAENQVNIAESIEKKGIAVNLGWYENVTVNKLKEVVEGLINDFHKRITMSLKSKEIVDGRGTERVAEKIIEFLNTQSIVI